MIISNQSLLDCGYCPPYSHTAPADAVTGRRPHGTAHGTAQHSTAQHSTARTSSSRWRPVASAARILSISLSSKLASSSATDSFFVVEVDGPGAGPLDVEASADAELAAAGLAMMRGFCTSRSDESGRLRYAVLLFVLYV